MALDLASALTLATLNNNVNAPDVVTSYISAFNGRTVIAPQGVGQIGAFAFDYQSDDEVDLSSEIPDHFLESNAAASDHIALKPYVVVARGFVAELSLSAAVGAALNAILLGVQNGLSAVPAYTGGYTPGAVQALQRAVSRATQTAIAIEQAVSRAAQVASFFRAGPALNRQQAAFFQLASLRDARVIFTVKTPWQVFPNMAIEHLRVIQPKETKDWTDFAVTMKQIQFTDDVSLSFFSSNFGGRAASDAQDLTQNGGTLGTAPAAGATPVSGFPA